MILDADPPCLQNNRHRMRMENVSVEDFDVVFTVYCELCLEIFHTQRRKQYLPQLEEELR